VFQGLSSTAAQLGSFVAAYAFLDQSIDDALVVVGAGMALAGALGAWAAGGPVFAARVVAAAQGTIWLILLIHGGKGLLFGPVAWLAAIIGSRFPAIAAGLLLLPVSWPVLGWAPTLSEGGDARDWLIVAALVVPAATAATIFLQRFVAGFSWKGST
jgi:hypothetical protein